MRPLFEKIPNAPTESCFVERVRGRSFGCTWHFHPEHELTLTLAGKGHRVVGDNISPLVPMDLVLVGSNLPHDWQAAREVRNNVVDAIVVQFRDDFNGPGCLKRPEFAAVQHLLQRAASGLDVRGASLGPVAQWMLQILEAHGLRRLVLLLRILECLSESSELHPIASPSFSPELNPADERRMRRVLEFVMGRLAEPIYLKDVARIAALSEGGFSRYFRSRTGKTFPAFINQLRLGLACRRLIENEEATVTCIAFDCGFTGLANFHRQFQRSIGMSPVEYRNHFRASSAQAGLASAVGKPARC